MEAVQQSEKPSFLLLSSCSPQIQENQKEEGNWSNVIVLTEITASGFDGIYPILIYHLHEHTQHPGFGLNITGPNTELMKVWLSVAPGSSSRCVTLWSLWKKGKEKCFSDLPKTDLLKLRLAESRELAQVPNCFRSKALHLFPSQRICSCIKGYCFCFEI